MSSSASQRNIPPLSHDILQEIAQYCDKETLKAYCSSSLLLRQAVTPFFFRASAIKFGIEYYKLSTEEHMASQQSYEAWAYHRTEKFEQLSASIYAKYVRGLSYSGFKAFSSPPGPSVDGVQSWKAQHHATAWVIFKKNLSRYTQLKELRFEYVDIDDEAIIAMGALQSLRDLSLTRNLDFTCTMELAMHHAVRPAHSVTYEPYGVPDEMASDLGAVFLAGACSNITSLNIMPFMGDGMHRSFYVILRNCRLLEELNVRVGTFEDTEVDETAPGGLEASAMPRLRDYSGPAYYASLVKGRPVIKIHVFPVPSDLDDTNVADWVQSTFVGTTSAVVESFSTMFFPADAVNDFLGAISTALPRLKELVMEIKGDFDDEVLHSLVQDLHEGVCVIPTSLQTLSLLWLDEDSDIDPEVIVDKVDEILSMPERLGKLESLTIGRTGYDYVVCKKSNVVPTEWTMKLEPERSVDSDSQSESEFNFTFYYLEFRHASDFSAPR